MKAGEVILGWCSGDGSRPNQVDCEKCLDEEVKGTQIVSVGSLGME